MPFTSVNIPEPLNFEIPRRNSFFYIQLIMVIAIYQDRGYDMYHTSGRKVGDCQPLGHNHYTCNNPFLGQHGKRLLRCRSHWTASEIMG